jgi:tetratricopeptide (TPR) repeat protein
MAWTGNTTRWICGSIWVIKEASDHLNLAVAIDPKVDQSVQLHQILGQYFARDGQFPEAILEYEKAIELARQQGKGEAVNQLTRVLTVLRKKQKSGG